jgi:hypothetical protein
MASVLDDDTLVELDELRQLLLRLLESLPRASLTLRQWEAMGEYPEEELN